MRHVCAHTQVTALVQVRVQGARSVAQWHSELQAFCRQRGLSRFKVPGVICCQTALLPVNNSGKIVKHKVKALLSEKLRHHGAVSKL
jgi:non-ribosomal peptide synthetase component E (peptide arylation enzyme)